MWLECGIGVSAAERARSFYAKILIFILDTLGNSFVNAGYQDQQRQHRYGDNTYNNDSSLSGAGQRGSYAPLPGAGSAFGLSSGAAAGPGAAFGAGWSGLDDVVFSDDDDFDGSGGEFYA